MSVHHVFRNLPLCGKCIIFIGLVLATAPVLQAGHTYWGEDVELNAMSRTFTAGSWSTVLQTGRGGEIAFTLSDEEGNLHLAGTLDRFLKIGDEYRLLGDRPVFFSAVLNVRAGSIRLTLTEAEDGESIFDFRLENETLKLVLASGDRPGSQRYRILHFQADGSYLDAWRSSRFQVEDRFQISTIVEDGNPPDVPPPPSGGN